MRSLIDSRPFGGGSDANASRKSRQRLDESDVAELEAFVAEDMTVEEIARELGRTVEAVRAKASAEGISLLPSSGEGDIDE
jgi:hypothetical protein